jgi:hypothetical protein
LYEDGTKFRYCKGTPNPKFPESIDLKITNRCNVGCVFCHENSVPNGKHADLEKTLEKIKCLPKGVEIAIGGGDPTSHPYLNGFLTDLCNLGYVSSITIRYGSSGFDTDSIHGAMGVSGMPTDKLKYIPRNVIPHIIAGITSIEELSHYTKVLVLGFKDFGRAEKMDKTPIEKCLSEWRDKIGQYIGTRHIMFDNLAIQQLNIKRLFTDKEWDNIYMGDDGKYTMYVDAVKGEFAINSTATERTSWDLINLLKFFKGVRK